ncbi:GNAT family N-acetyltransferase [Paenibacillus xerothermodurans]
MRTRLKGIHAVTPLIVEYEDTPIDYMQCYELDSTTLQEYGYQSKERVFGMDQFIGEHEKSGFYKVIFGSYWLIQ